MVLELDSVEQALTWQRFVAEGEPGDSSLDQVLPEAFSGQVRLPFLYGNRLVVTDSQVFDGVLMLAAGPTGVAELLGSVHRSDILVMLREDSPRESLKKMLESPKFYSSAGVAKWSAETLDRRREDWIKAIENQRVGSAKFADFDFAGALAARLAADPPPNHDGDDLISGLLTTKTRSEAKEAIEAGGIDASQQRAVFDWWNRAYMDVVALRHRSVWITTRSPGVALAGESNGAGKTLPIPEVIVDLLSSIAGAEFATLVADAAPVLAKLRSRKRVIDRLRLALLVLNVAAAPQPLMDFVALAARIATFVLLILSAILGSGGLAGLPAWLGISVAVLLIVAQLPFVDILRFFRLFRRSSRAIMRTPGWVSE